MGQPSVLISIETMNETASKQFGQAFMEALIRQSDRLTPELVSTSEKFKEPFGEMDEFVEKWWSMPIQMFVDGRFTGERFGGPLWKRKSALASRGKINHGMINNNGQRFPSTLWFESAGVRKSISQPSSVIGFRFQPPQSACFMCSLTRSNVCC